MVGDGIGEGSLAIEVLLTLCLAESGECLKAALET